MLRLVFPRPYIFAATQRFFNGILQLAVVAALSTASVFPIFAQTSGSTRLHMLDRLAQQASSTSDSTELIHTLISTSYSPLFSSLPANDPLVAQLASLHAAAVSHDATAPTQTSTISDNNIASAFDGWRSTLGLRDFPPTTNRDVHYYRLFLSGFAPHLIPLDKAVGQVAWRLTPAEAIYVLDLMIGSGGLPSSVTASHGGQHTINITSTTTVSPATQEYRQAVSHYYATTSLSQRREELSDLLTKLGITFQDNSPTVAIGK